MQSYIPALQIWIPMGRRTQLSHSMYAPKFFLHQAKQTVDMSQTDSASPKHIVFQGQGMVLPATCHAGKRKVFYFGAIMDLAKTDPSSFTFLLENCSLS